MVIGASAGGVEALRMLVGGLPSDLAAAVFVVLHVPRESASALPTILDRSGPLPVRQAVDAEPIRAGHVYVAPPDSHMVVSDDQVKLTKGPRENGHRPAIDPLFRSAARAFGPRVVGVVLSGSRDDGTAGLASVVRQGGRALVQDPDEALHASMPRSALEHVPGTQPYLAGELGAAIAERVNETPANPAMPPVDPLLAAETVMAEMEPLTTDQLPGQPAGFGCPSCHGGLFELRGEPVPRYRCRVGHAWSPESLLDEQSETLEAALWMALRSLEEKAALGRKMAESARMRGNTGSASRYDSTAADTDGAIKVLRELIPRLSALRAGASDPVKV